MDVWGFFLSGCLYIKCNSFSMLLQLCQHLFPIVPSEKTYAAASSRLHPMLCILCEKALVLSQVTFQPITSQIGSDLQSNKQAIIVL